MAALAPTRWHDEVDVGVIGAGGCGLTAARAAARAGLQVAVWEKAAAAGGMTALSNALLPAAGTRFQRAAGIVDTADDLARDVFVRNGSRSDAALTRRLCETSATLLEWLTDTCGIPFALVTHVADPGHTRPRLHAPPSRHGQALIDGLLRQLSRCGVQVQLNAPVQQVLVDADGAVTGVQVKRPRRSPVNVRCHKLIVASDGFAANRELMDRHCPAAVTLPYAGAATSSGDALAWAAEVGAATQHLDAYGAHATVALGTSLPIPWALLERGAILVNQRGERFTDESAGPAALGAALLSQPGRLAYEILDADILRRVAAEDPHFATTVAPRALRRADDVDAVAKQFQIDAQVLLATIAAYNAAADGGGAAYGRRRVGAPLAPPFYAVRVSPALLETQGGLAIDIHARVLRTDGVQIPNLYAGGGAAVGLSGPGGDGYLLGNGLLCALGWGRIAGEHAAEERLAAVAASQAATAPEGAPSS